METVSSPMVADVKLLVLNLEIVNGDSPPPKRTIDGVEQPYPPTTVDEKLARKNELKARKKRFRGDKELKKTQKTLLKHQYENFNGSRSKGLDQTHDRLQKIISQLEIPGAYKVGLEYVDARLDVYKKNEVVFEEDIQILKLDIKLRDNALIEPRKKFEKAEKERDDFKLALEKFGIHQKTSKLYHDVPPPYTGNFMPPKSDLVLADEDEYGFSESVTSIPDVATSEAKTSELKSKSVGEPLIEDWISDSEDENKTESKSKQRKSSFAKVKFVKTNEHVKTPKGSG
ncbi:hypothetical protein Tco_0175333 [Tanacetum coccineum]